MALDPLEPGIRSRVFVTVSVSALPPKVLSDVGFHSVLDTKKFTVEDRTQLLPYTYKYAAMPPELVSTILFDVGALDVSDTEPKFMMELSMETWHVLEEENVIAVVFPATTFPAAGLGVYVPPLYTLFTAKGKFPGIVMNTMLLGTITLRFSPA